jgi:SAM-dependent methyltransferase
MLEVQTLIDLAVDLNMAPSAYFTQWHEYADWQMKALRQHGLLPQHRLLDVGCGALRLGHLAIAYLDPGNYCGIDPDGRLLDLGRAVLRRLGVDRPHSLRQSSAFDFERFGMSFDFAMAQSVFTYLSQAQIEQCVEHLKTVMKPGGKFIFTYWFNPNSPRLGFLADGITPTYMPGLKDDALFQALAERLGIAFASVPSDHPTQLVGLMTF